jgi:hypothetical protein
VSSAGQQTTGKSSGTATDFKKKTLEAVETLKNYSIEKKDKSVSEVKVALEKMDARIDRMQSRVENNWNEMDQASREKAKKTLQALRKKRNELSEWYSGMKHSSADAWDHVKKGSIDVCEALAAAFDKAENEFGSDESDKTGHRYGGGSGRRREAQPGGKRHSTKEKILPLRGTFQAILEN